MTTTATDLQTHLVELRRDLHRHPELSWREERTAARIAGELDAIGVTHRRVAKTGVVADMPGPSGAPIVALRADTDALPITEETGHAFASANNGVMHACGHDGHTTMLVGAGRLLADRAQLPAPVRLIFQPAEEHGGGAAALIEAGVLDGVGVIFGGHIDRLYAAGEIVAVPGPMNASTDEFTIELTAAGGHAARPHESPDPIVVGSAIVAALQTIVAREVDPTAPAVVTVGQFHAGTASNVIASRATLEGTLRAQDAKVRAHLKKAVLRHAEAVASAYGVAAHVTIHEGTPPVVNREPWVEPARRAAQAVVGDAGLAPMRTANMGGEDFGFYLERVPGCYVRFGARPEGESYPAHSSRFTWDESALIVGARYFAEVAIEAARVFGE
jgi:amidohydrolase